MLETTEKPPNFWNSFSESDKQKIDARYQELREGYITLQNLRNKENKVRK